MEPIHNKENSEDKANLKQNEAENVLVSVNDYAIRNRRERVFELKLKGYSNREIAEVLEVDRSTIDRDLKTLKGYSMQRANEIVGRFDHRAYWSERMARLDFFSRAAWTEIEAGRNVPNMLKILLEIEGIRERCFRSLGLFMEEKWGDLPKKFLEKIHTDVHFSDFKDEFETSEKKPSDTKKADGDGKQ